VVRRSHRFPTSAEEPASASTSRTSADGSSHKSFASANPASALSARDLHKGSRLKGVSIAVADGETLVVLGPSGAGKTTLLRVLAGLESIERGRIELDGRDVSVLPPQRRGIAMVFQDDALFPHMSVFENLAFGMRVRDPKRVREMAEALGIAAHLHTRPARLSGGERQRAAIARAVLGDPRVLLLDEPFAHLDPQLRAYVRRQFAEVRGRFPGPAIHVTHDHVEALSIGDRLAIMIDGAIVQVGSPQHVYDSPADVRIARFFGSPPMNLFDGEMEITGIRPERIVFDDRAPLRGVVESRESTGADTFVRVRTARGEAVVRVSGMQRVPACGDAVGLDFPEAFVRRFNATTGVLIQ
jgi:ABC-type sugar transport system ATPase subunit